MSAAKLKSTYLSSAMYCQKCRTPIRLDGSLEELNPAAFKLLTGTLKGPIVSEYLLSMHRNDDAHEPTNKPTLSPGQADIP